MAAAEQMGDAVAEVQMGEAAENNSSGPPSPVPIGLSRPGQRHSLFTARILLHRVSELTHQGFGTYSPDFRK